MKPLHLLRDALAIKGALSLFNSDAHKIVSDIGQIKLAKKSKHINMPKLLIIGHGRHGKDTLAEIFARDYGMTFKASSMAASEIFIYDVLKDKYGYRTPAECFNDRSNHRKEWYDLICLYNEHDKAKLAKSIMSTSNCYVGMRDKPEIKECMKQGVFDLVIWVDASNRLPKEPKDSFNITTDNADILISNNGTLKEFEAKAKRLGNIIFKR
jgi:DNA polymerase III delta prime subunit